MGFLQCEAKEGKDGQRNWCASSGTYISWWRACERRNISLKASRSVIAFALAGKPMVLVGLPHRGGVRCTANRYAFGAYKVFAVPRCACEES